MLVCPTWSWCVFRQHCLLVCLYCVKSSVPAVLRYFWCCDRCCWHGVLSWCLCCLLAFTQLCSVPHESSVITEPCREFCMKQLTVFDQCWLVWQVLKVLILAPVQTEISPTQEQATHVSAVECWWWACLIWSGTRHVHPNHCWIKKKNNAAAAYSTQSQSGKPSISANKLFRLDELTASSVDLQTIRQNQVHKYSRDCLEIIAFFTAKRLIKQSRVYHAHLAHLQGCCIRSAALTVLFVSTAADKQHSQQLPRQEPTCTLSTVYEYAEAVQQAVKSCSCSGSVSGACIQQALSQ